MKGAFTLLEALVIIVVTSVLVSIAIASYGDPDELYLARDQIIRHIRYTQHLAVMDDKFDPNDPFWERKKWRIIFGSSMYPEYAGGIEYGWTYTIFADLDNKGNHSPTTGEIAVDPYTKRLLTGGYGVGSKLKSSDPKAIPEMALWHWRIEKFEHSSACNQSIAFDEIGRPYTLSTDSDSLRLITQTCKYTLIHQNKEAASICIEPETGYTHECD